MADDYGPEWVKTARAPLDLRASSRLVGVHRNTLWAWENGKGAPGAIQIAALKVLRRCIDEFLTTTEAEK